MFTTGPAPVVTLLGNACTHEVLVAETPLRRSLPSSLLKPTHPFQESGFDPRHSSGGPKAVHCPYRS